MKDVFFKIKMLKGEAGATITKIEKVEETGGVYVFRITLSDGSTEDFEVDEVVDNTIVNQLIAAAAPGIVQDATAQAAANLSTVLNAIYPVGTIYSSVVNTNPSTFFGFGTWELFGQGKALVGVDTNDSDFDTPLKTGGSKTSSITGANMPLHNHKVQYPGTPLLADSFIYGDFTADDEGINKYILHANEDPDSSSFPSDNGTLQVRKVTDGSADHPLTTETVGGGQAFSTMSPYVAVYLWRRTA